MGYYTVNEQKALEDAEEEREPERSVPHSANCYPRLEGNSSFRRQLEDRRDIGDIEEEDRQEPARLYQPYNTRPASAKREELRRQQQEKEEEDARKEEDAKPE
jgi:hypothetical protein